MTSILLTVHLTEELSFSWLIILYNTSWNSAKICLSLHTEGNRAQSTSGCRFECRNYETSNCFAKIVVNLKTLIQKWQLTLTFAKCAPNPAWITVGWTDPSKPEVQQNNFKTLWPTPSMIIRPQTRNIPIVGKNHPVRNKRVNHIFLTLHAPANFVFELL
jgi:hypothetical protein